MIETEIQAAGHSVLMSARARLINLLTRTSLLGMAGLAVILYSADNKLYIAAALYVPAFALIMNDWLMSYRGRVGCLVALFIIAGLLVTFSRMEPLGGRIWVVVAASLAAILVGMWSGLITLFAGFTALFIPFLLIEYSILPWSGPTDKLVFSDWVVQISSGLIPGGIVVYSFGYVFNWLGHSEGRAKMVTDNAIDVIWSTDADKTITYVTPSVEKFTGYRAEEVMGTKITDIFSQEGRQLLEDFLQSSDNSDEDGVSTNAKLFEIDFRRRDGSTVCSETNVRINRGEQGNIVGYTGVTRDISRRKQAEEQRSSLEEQLLHSQKMDSMGQLAGGIAHDFNNLLGVILGYADLIRTTDVDRPEVKEWAKEISIAGERAATMTRQLLLFSRKENAGREPQAINELIDSLITMLERLLPSNIDLQCDLGGSIKAVSGDVGQLEQVIVNLVVNARDAMPEGGTIHLETRQVTVDAAFLADHSWADAGQYCLIKVVDSGMGIPADQQNRIFEPFYTSKEQGKGTGLGLSVVFGIVKQHKGIINLYSEEHHGSEFHVYLPVVEQAAVSQQVSVEMEAEGGNERILLIEDNDALRLMALQILRNAGYSVTSACNGLLGLNTFYQQPDAFDLIFTDVIMPEMGGDEVVNKIRELRPDIPVLFASGYTTEDVHLQFVVKEGLKILSKPYVAGPLLREVRAALNNGGKSLGPARQS